MKLQYCEIQSTRGTCVHISADPLMRTGSTAVSYRDNLELVYSQKPYLSGHIEVSRMQGGTALQEAPGFIYTPKHVQEKKQHTLSKICTPFSVKVMQGKVILVL